MATWLDEEAANHETELPPAPDYSEPFLGWRLWALEDVNGSARLRSLYRRCIWPTEAPLVARCHARRFKLWGRSPHEAPVGTCSCGIYAVRPDGIPGLWRDPEIPPGFLLVMGTVSLWGDVVECERGWRAGVAYPRELFVPCLAPQPFEIAAALADYGVPVEVLDARTISTALEAVADRTV